MNQKKVCVVTGTRAEYGLFYPVLKEIKASKLLHLQLVVSTMHLSNEFGLTYKTIENDGFIIDEKIENILSVDTKSAVVKSTGLAMVLLSDAYKRLNPDIVLLLGDRYETHAAATAAMLMNIPIAHIHGGEVTEGAVDEQIRHSITKMSQLHFATTEQYRKRIIQMGENPSSVITSGAPGIDNIINMELMSKEDLENDLNWKFGAISALFTYHPVTLENCDIVSDLRLIFEAISLSGLTVLFTYANSDDGGRIINKMLEEFCRENPVRYKVVKSLGQLRYLSAMKNVDLLVGNTSSGIIEAASFNKPVVNIGIRQQGRLQSDNVINTDVNSLDLAIKKALSESFVKQCNECINIYGKGNAAEKIVSALVKHPFCTTKKFVDFNIGFLE